MKGQITYVVLRFGLAQCGCAVLFTMLSCASQISLGGVFVQWRERIHQFANLTEVGAPIEARLDTRPANHEGRGLKQGDGLVMSLACQRNLAKPTANSTRAVGSTCILEKVVQKCAYITFTFFLFRKPSARAFLHCSHFQWSAQRIKYLGTRQTVKLYSALV